MITLREYLTAIDFKITGGSEYGWDCFGHNARYLDCQESEGYGGAYSIHAIFDSVDQTVYCVELWDYINDREYRWTHPDYVKAYKKNCKKMGVNRKEAIDGRNFIELDVPADILQKIACVVAGEEYDERVQIAVNFADDELLQYMKLAHEHDMTFNQFVEEALRHAIEEVKTGQLTKEDAQKFIDDNYSEI